VAGRHRGTSTTTVEPAAIPPAPWPSRPERPSPSLWGKLASTTGVIRLIATIVMAVVHRVGAPQAITTNLPPGEAVRPFAAVRPSLPQREEEEVQAILATAETPAEPPVKMARIQVRPAVRFPVEEPPITVAPDRVVVAVTMAFMVLKQVCPEYSSKEVIRKLMVAFRKPVAAVGATSVAAVAAIIPAVPAVRAISVA
jgi:hypothetical protein